MIHHALVRFEHMRRKIFAINQTEADLVERYRYVCTYKSK